MAVFDVAVIGLGAMGSAALEALARRGVRAVGFEQFEPGHARGSSHGESRVIRTAYSEHPDYVPLVRLAYGAWRGLEARTGQQVMTVTGIVEAGFGGSPMVAASLKSAVEHGIPHQVLDARDVRARFPALNPPDGWDCVFQADGGVLEPEKAVRLFVNSAKALGVSVRTGVKVTAIDASGDGVRVRLAGGETVQAGAAVVAAGPWIGQLVPELAPHLHLTRQPLIWFRPVEPALTGPDRLPVFLFEAPDDILYGLPDITGTGVKAASHRPGARLAGPDAERAEATGEEQGVVARGMARYVPAAAGPVTRTAVCTYTHTPDEHFLIGPHPGAPRIVLASPCSGHGFKFASIIGETLADLALDGGTDKPIGLFDPRRYLR